MSVFTRWGRYKQSCARLNEGWMRGIKAFIKNVMESEVLDYLDVFWTSHQSSTHRNNYGHMFPWKRTKNILLNIKRSLIKSCAETSLNTHISENPSILFSWCSVIFICNTFPSAYYLSSNAHKTRCYLQQHHSAKALMLAWGFLFTVWAWIL